METAPQKVTSPSWSTSPKEVNGYHKAKQKKKKKQSRILLAFMQKKKKLFTKARNNPARNHTVR